MYNEVFLQQSISSCTFGVTLSVQTVHHWPARKPSGVLCSPWRPCWLAPLACRPILTAERLRSALPLSLASAAVCDTYATWPPIRDSQGGSDLDNLMATGPSQLSQDSWRAATPAWHVLCAQERRLAGKSSGINAAANFLHGTWSPIFVRVRTHFFIIALATSPCSRSVCIRTLSICDTFPIVTALS